MKQKKAMLKFQSLLRD